MQHDPNLTTPEEIANAYIDELYDRRHPGEKTRVREEGKMEGKELGMAQVLKLFAERNPSMSAEQIAETIGLEVETVRRLLLVRD
jgi:predicted transposase YdaD